MPAFLSDIMIFLVAAVVAVPIAQRLGLGSVLGFLLAGVVIGPWGLNIGPTAGEIWTTAELGVVLLLFVIGIEMQPKRLWALRRVVFGVGGLQVALSAFFLAAASVFLGHLGVSASIVAGLALALSSTAFALQLLSERGELRSHHGRGAFAILLFQDLAVVPILALLPLLSVGGVDIKLTAALWQIAKAVVVLSGVIVGGHYLLRPVLRVIALTRVPELFTAATLLIVIGIGSLMSLAGLSVALGAFVAGVLLADSEYRHQLAVTVAPFKGLLLGLFFMAVGMSINLGLIATHPFNLLAMTIGLMAIKGLVIYSLARRNRLSGASARRLAATISQGGEFAFVILTQAMAKGLFEQSQVDHLVAAVTLSMVLTPLVVVLVDKIEGKTAVQDGRRIPKNHWDQESEHPVIIAGFGRVGQIVARVLHAQKIGFIALDNSPERIDFVRKYGSRAFYGNPTHIDILRAAGAAEARLFILAIDNVEDSIRCAKVVQRYFPDLPIIARARNRKHAYKLMELGINIIHRETFRSSLDIASDALKNLGVPPERLAQTVKEFRMRDQQRLYEHRSDANIKNRAARLVMGATQELEEQFERDAKEHTEKPRKKT